MKCMWIVLGALVAVWAIAAESSTNLPAKTPEELGRRAAEALISGDTNAVTILLPSYEAYLPICQLNLGETPATEPNLRLVHSRWMGRLMEEVSRFPSEFTKATHFEVNQIEVVDVSYQQESGRTNWADVDIVFKVKDQKFRITLDECLRFSNAWYIVDFDWGGEIK